MAMSALVAAPFIDVLALEGGVHWLAAYGAVAASGDRGGWRSCLVTTALFEMVGAKRTRLVAQIVAAVIGAGFVIAMQLRGDPVDRDAVAPRAPHLGAVVAIAPDAASAMWWPARAILGDAKPLRPLPRRALCSSVASILLVAPRFARLAHRGVGHSTREEKQRATSGVPHGVAARDVASQGMGTCCGATLGSCRRR